MCPSGYNVNDNTHLIHYEDDNATEYLNLNSERIHWSTKQHTTANLPQSAPAAMAPSGPGVTPLPPSDQVPKASTSGRPLPSVLNVVCNGMRGCFDVQKMMLIGQDGREVSPTEFERIAGRSAAKKCKLAPLWKSADCK